jgi:hypothetical protein
MARVIRSDQAQQDLEEILDYLDSQSTHGCKGQTWFLVFLYFP